MAENTSPLTPEPLSRVEQQQRTRDALVTAARTEFAREGFHGASLAAIARSAGLSKGAVYSNFDSKSDLFLAVIDADLDQTDLDTLEGLDLSKDVGDLTAETSDDRSAEEDTGWRFALATMEFGAAAGRDPALAEAFSERMGRVVAAFEPVAARHRRDDEPLSNAQLASMLAAFDQGVAGLVLLGWPTVDGDLVRRAIRRLLTPVDGEVGANS